MEWERAGKFNKHHDKPKARNGTKNFKNILKLDVNRHRAYHFLFGNRTLLEAAALLKRTYYYQQRRKE